jgi:hypothetical protein
MGLLYHSTGVNRMVYKVLPLGFINLATKSRCEMREKVRP